MIDAEGDEDAQDFSYLKVQDTAIANAILRDIVIKPEFIVNFEEGLWHRRDWMEGGVR